MQRMGHLLSRYDLPVRKAAGAFLDGIDAEDAAAALFLREGRISGGFHLPGMKIVLLSEEEIFGKKVLRRRVRPAREGYFLKSFGELTEGDFVVHTEHGIGRYQGLQKLTAGGIENDFLLIGYQDQDRLYLPVDRIDQIQRYIGPDGFVPKVDKLGGTSWETVKERVKKSVREMAEELVSIYAAREVMGREAFSAPDRIYEEFCASFEFEETPDQAKAIEEIHARHERRQADGPPDLRRRGVREDRGGDAGLAPGRPGREAGGGPRSHDDPGRAASPDLFPAAETLPDPGRGPQPFPDEGRAEGDPRRPRAGDGGHRDRHPPPPPEGRGVPEPGAGHHRRGAALRRQPQGETQEAPDAGRRPDADGDPDPPDAAPVARRASGTCPSSTPRRRTACR